MGRGRLVGTNRADRNGEWSVSDSDGDGGTYYAVAKELTRTFRPKPGARKKKFVCIEDESPPFER